MLKSTYGYGLASPCSTPARDMVRSKNRLLTTIALPPRRRKRPTRSEGSIFVAGAAVQWLRDGLKVIKAAPDTGSLAESAIPPGRSIFVPAFTGLGAPSGIRMRGRDLRHDAQYRPGRVCAGGTRGGLLPRPATCWRPCTRHWRRNGNDTVLRFDAGMVASDWTMQRLSDLLDAPVDRPVILENNGAWRRLACGQPRRRLAEPGGVRQGPGPATAVSNRYGRGHAQGEAQGLRSAVKRTLIAA